MGPADLTRASMLLCVWEGVAGNDNYVCLLTTLRFTTDSALSSDSGKVEVFTQECHLDNSTRELVLQ